MQHYERQIKPDVLKALELKQERNPVIILYGPRQAGPILEKWQKLSTPENYGLRIMVYNL